MKELSLEEFSSVDIKQQLISTLCEQPAIDISIAYNSDFKSAKLLREVVDSLCKWFAIEPKWRTRLVLIIDELNNNAIEYGSMPGDQNYMNLQLVKNESWDITINVAVIDTGLWDQAKTAMEMHSIKKENENKDFSHHRSIRWRGLFLIISHLVDDLYFKDSPQGGLIVGAQKVLQGTQK